MSAIPSVSRICHRIRNQHGSLAILLPCAILIVVIGLGMFAMDVSHNVTTRTELQNATDAAALAGAQDLVDPNNESQCPEKALQIAEENTSDGRAVSNNSDSTVVTSTYEIDNVDNYGTCSVDATMTIRNMFAGLIGHYFDDVAVKSRAVAYRSIIGIDQDQAFPLAVSIDTKNSNNKEIYKMNIGDTFTLEINSQRFKNAAFTSFSKPNPNAAWLNNAIDLILFGQESNHPTQGGTIPAFEVGEDLNLINGVAGQKHLADPGYEQRLLDTKQLVLPCMTGEPPYNQSRTCVGFITVDILDVQTNGSGGHVETFVCKLVKGITRGTGGLPDEANNQINKALEDISAGTVKLAPPQTVY